MISLPLVGDHPDDLDALYSIAASQPQVSVDEWRAARRRGLGGSDAPVVLGLSPWKAALTLWGEKTGRLAEPVLDSDAVEMGKVLEPAILERYRQKTGRAARPWPATLIVQHAEVEFLRATPDGLTFDNDLGLGLVQLKSTGEFTGKEWDDGPPVHVEAQVQHELAATGARWGSIVVLIGGRRLKWFDVKPNDEFVGIMLEREAEFWRHVVEDRQPEVSEHDALVGGKDLGRTLAALYGRDMGDSVALPDEAVEVDRRLREIKAEQKQLETEREALETRLKGWIGSASVGVLPNGRSYSWKSFERAGYVVEPTSGRMLRELGK